MTLDETNPIIISLNAFTPDGWNVKVSINADSFMTSDLPYAVQLDVWLAGHGFLPGLKANEHTADIAYVIRRNHKNKDNGEVTPVIGFYADGELKFKYAHLYLNSTEDRQQFEAQSGLQLDKLPVWPSSAFPAKTDDSFQQYAVKVANTFKMVKEKVGEDAEGRPDNDYRYLTPVALPSSTTNGKPSENGSQSVEWANKDSIAEMVKGFQEKTNTNAAASHLAQMAGIDRPSNYKAWNKAYPTDGDAKKAIWQAYQDGALTRIQESELSGMDAIEQAAKAESPK